MMLSFVYKSMTWYFSLQLALMLLISYSDCSDSSPYIGSSGVVEKPHVFGLFKNVQMQGAQKTEP